MGWFTNAVRAMAGNSVWTILNDWDKFLIGPPNAFFILPSFHATSAGESDTLQPRIDAAADHKLWVFVRSAIFRLRSLRDTPAHFHMRLPAIRFRSDLALPGDANNGHRLVEYMPKETSPVRHGA